jgi:hypothetical protein
MGTTEGSAARVQVRDRLAVWAFCCFWLLPVIYVGTTRRAPPLPAPMVELTNVTCLFTHAQPTWSAFFVEIRTRPGGPWVELDTQPYFGLRPFGHRTRLDRYLVAWSGRRGDPARDELARWFMREHQRRHPEAPAIVELRFVVAAIGVHPERPPSSAWTRPRLEDVPPNHRRILSTHVASTDP